MEDKKQRADSGQQGGGSGRRDEVGRTGVWPASGPWPPGGAPLVGQAEFGQGGTPSADESGTSELVVEQKDPVCGVYVRPEDSPSMEYGGRRYWFESEDCMRRFQESPERYIAGQAQ